MRTLIYSIIPIVISLVVWSGCTAESGKTSNVNVSTADSLVRSMALSIYSAPDSIADLSRTLLSEPHDSVMHHYLTTSLGFSSLLLGDRPLYDSLTEATSRFTDTHPGEAALHEFFYRNRAVVFNLMGLNDSAYVYMAKALRAATALGATDLIVEDEAALGDFAEALGELPLATSHMRKAVAMADSAQYTGQRSFAVSLGSLYAAMGNFDEADRYFDLHRQHFSDYPAYINFFFYSALGNRYYYQQRYSEASDNFHNALDLIRSIDDVALEAMTEVNLGECQMYAGQLDSATLYIEAGIERFGRMGLQDKTQRAYMESLLGDLAMRKGDYSRSGKLLLSVDTLSLPPKYRMLHYNRMVDFLHRTGDWHGALDYKNKAIDIERSLHDIDTRNYAAELESRYMQDTTILHAKVAMGKKEEEVFRLRQWIYLAIALSVAIVAVIVALALYNANRRRKALAAIQQSLMGLRLESTRNRMAPHFIFNVLNSEVNLKENQAVLRLIELIRRNLELAERPVVTLQEEIEFIQSYIEVKQSSLGDDFEFRLIIDPDVNMSSKIPAMMVELFVENAVKHGLQGYPGHKILEVEIKRKGSAVEISVKNNGLMTSPAAAKGTGTGLRIVSQTLHTLNAINPSPIILTQTIKDCPDVDGERCYVVVLSIPDNYDFSPLTK